MRLIGFDFGIKRIGLATGNTITHTAQALKTISCIKQQPDWQQITKIIDEWKPALLLVGLPLHLDGTENDMTAQVKKFGDQLQNTYQLSVEFVDERFTSSHADALLQESNEKNLTNRRKKQRDGLAAELIITTYLNDNRCP